MLPKGNDLIGHYPACVDFWACARCNHRLNPLAYQGMEESSSISMQFLSELHLQNSAFHLPVHGQIHHQKMFHQHKGRQSCLPASVPSAGPFEGSQHCIWPGRFVSSLYPQWFIRSLLAVTVRPLLPPGIFLFLLNSLSSGLPKGFLILSHFMPGPNVCPAAHLFSCGVQMNVVLNQIHL